MGGIRWGFRKTVVARDEGTSVEQRRAWSSVVSTRHRETQHCVEERSVANGGRDDGLHRSGRGQAQRDLDR